jgi:hypothetical protein
MACFRVLHSGIMHPEIPGTIPPDSGNPVVNPASALVHFTTTASIGKLGPTGTLTAVQAGSHATSPTTICWSAPGNDWNVGTAASYDRRAFSKPPTPRRSRAAPPSRALRPPPRRVPSSAPPSRPRHRTSACARSTRPGTSPIPLWRTFRNTESRPPRLADRWRGLRLGVRSDAAGAADQASGSVQPSGREALDGPRSPLGSVELPVLGRSRRHEPVEQTGGRCRDLLNSAVEDLRIGARGLG